MGSVRQEVLWSPLHASRFVTWGTDLCLYEIGPIKELAGAEAVVKTSETTQAVLLATNSPHRFVKCVDINPQSEDDLLAIGLASGKVVLTAFGHAKQDMAGREFTPLHPRPCNTVTWNPVETNIIAVGLEKSRTEPGVLLWDAYRCPHHFAGDGRGDYAKPVAEFALSETANSLAWINASLLVAGLNNKSLRIVDRRDSLKTVQNTATKAVYGVCVDTHSEQILASYHENQISVWDIRNFEKPIATIARMKAVSKILWCATRRNLLGSLQRESNTIVLHDVQVTTLGNDEVEPAVLERAVQPAGGHNITSFSWHPTTEGRLLTISLSGTLTDYHVVERITLNWLPCSHLVWTHGRRVLKVIGDSDPIYATFSDISVKIKKRALADYGLKPELWQNGELAEDQGLRHLWYWLYLSRNLVEEGVVHSNAGLHPGVMTVLAWDRCRSDAMDVPWGDVGSSVTARVYRSEERTAALQLCGWRPAALGTFLERLQVEGASSRAAAIAVFNLKLRLAISILTQAAGTRNPSLSVVAMALSGFSDDRGSMWREHCMQSRGKLADPYLRATFAFLTADNDNYDLVLSETGVAVEDRVAFACTFLSDAKLTDYLTRLTEKLTEEGDLSGVLLTGAGLEGMRLLQSYLDLTGDVQSVSLLAVRAFPPEIQTEPTVATWVASYQQLLDSKRLWNQRAHFDVALNNQCEKLPQQVFVSCNFCGKGISGYMQSRGRGGGPRGVAPTNKQKMSSCPNCRKPLPRCAICLVHMGTSSRGVQDLGLAADEKVAELGTWFTWCQTCRHGGHAGHVDHWFSSHSECPVTGCTCKCMSLDPTCPGNS